MFPNQIAAYRRLTPYHQGVLHAQTTNSGRHWPPKKSKLSLSIGPQPLRLTHSAVLRHLVLEWESWITDSPAAFIPVPETRQAPLHPLSAVLCPPPTCSHEKAQLLSLATTRCSYGPPMQAWCAHLGWTKACGKKL